MSLECPRSHGRVFVRIARTFRYEPRAFLWWSWLAEVPDGWIVRCPDPNCSRIWRVDRNGVHVPAGHESLRPEPETGKEREREREDGEPPPPLGLAVRRERV